MFLSFRKAIHSYLPLKRFQTIRNKQFGAPVRSRLFSGTREIDDDTTPLIDDEFVKVLGEKLSLSDITRNILRENVRRKSLLHLLSPRDFESKYSIDYGDAVLIAEWAKKADREKRNAANQRKIKIYRSKADCFSSVTFENDAAFQNHLKLNRADGVVLTSENMKLTPDFSLPLVISSIDLVNDGKYCFHRVMIQNLFFPTVTKYCNESLSLS